MRRAAVSGLAAVALLLTWGRDPIDPIDPTAPVTFSLLAPPGGEGGAAGGDLTLAGAWRLDSRNRAFGGYSALVSLPGGSLLAGSDAGGVLLVERPGSRAMAGSFPELAATEGRDKRDVDLESLTIDSAGETLWASYERSNAVERYDLALNREARARPAAMRGWRRNGGAEAFVRLADGRFVAIAEVRRRGEPPGHRAVLFDSDPAEGSEGRGFAMMAPGGMRPVDMTQLPDGRVLVLLRSLDRIFPPRFASALAVMDPADLEPGAQWTPRATIALPRGTPPENYEGLAVGNGPDGTVRLWLVSDDNFTSLQRTLLVALDWRG